MSANNCIERLKTVFCELTGEELQSADLKTNFFDLGYDSLALTQASGALKKHFNVKVSFRELVESYTTIEELADHIDSLVPSKESAAKGEQATETETKQIAAATPSSNHKDFSDDPTCTYGAVKELQDATDSCQLDRSGTVLEKIMDSQLKIMEVQLAMLRGSSQIGPVDCLSSPQDQLPAQTDKDKTTTSGKATRETAPKKESNQHGPFKPAEKNRRRGLSDRQKNHIEWLTGRYVPRTIKSKEYTQRYRKHFADPRAVAGFNQQWKELVYPVVATRSAGAYLWDVDGNRWLDVTLGFGVNLLGHSPPFITEILKKQLDLGVEIGPQSPIAGEVAELVCEFTGMDRVAFCNTGSEAVMAAIRLCRTVTGRTRIVFFAGDYHGTFDEVLARGIWTGDEPKTLPLAPGVAPNLISEVTVLEYGTDRSISWIKENGAELAAVIVEPVQSRNPGLQPSEFLKELRRITEKEGTPLIFDEVITGFRCHPGGAQSYFGVRADLATYGKVIGGGMPIGFIAGRKEYMDALDGGFWQFGDESFPPSGVTFFAGTFIRHPLAMASAKAMLLHLKEEGPELQSKLAERTSQMVGTLNEYFKANQVPVELNHFTSIWYPKFGDQVKYSSLLYYHLREKGLHIWEGRPCFLSTVHTADDEEFIVNAFKASIEEMQQGGFMPGISGQAGKKQSEHYQPEGERKREKTAIQNNSTPIEYKRFPLSEAQQEMWVGAQMSPEAAGPHHACTGIYLEGNLDIEHLREAIRLVVDRHVALRCTFSEEGDEVILKPSITTEIPVHDLSDQTEAQQKKNVDTILLHESKRIFDLQQGPLFEFQIVKLSGKSHMLIFTVQMIVCDGWSHYVVFEDIGTIYSALVKGDEPQLKNAIPMWEYTAWERKNSLSDRAEECESFWVSQFEDIPAPINFPTLLTRPPNRTVEGSRQEITLSENLFNKVKQSAKVHKSSYFAIFLASFGAWIHHLSRSEDVVIGVPFAAQGPLVMDRLVGQCANILPLRIRFDSHKPFKKLLENTWNSVLDAQENWDFSFGRLIDKMDLPNDPSRIPLVSVLFNLDPPMSKVRFGELEHKFVAAPRYYFQYDMGFNLVEFDNTIRVECDFNRNLFDDRIIKIWLQGYEALLEAAVQQSDYPVNLLPMETQNKPEQFLLNKLLAKIDEDIELTVDQMFAIAAKNAQDAPAIGSEGGLLTYRELDHLSSCMTSHLRHLGFNKGTVVAVSCPPSIYLPAVLLAILKLGGTYVLIDPSYPVESVARFAGDYGVALVLAASGSNITNHDISIPVVDLTEIINTSSRKSSDESNSLGDLDHPACIICKSGVDEELQGIEITHRTIVNCLLSLIQNPGIGSEDVVLWHSPTISAYEILECWLPLSVGAQIFVSENSIVHDANAVSNAVDRRAITMMVATPSAWRMLLETGWGGSENLKALSWGERLASDIARQLIDNCKGVWNLYGTPEVAMVATVGQVGADRLVSLGHPINNTRVVAVGENQKIVPVGVPGELVIAGVDSPQLNRESTAEERKNSVDLSGDSGEVVQFIRTGDLVRYHPGGDSEFCGKIEGVCSINNINFHPGEVESVLIEHSAVRDTAVRYRRDDDSFNGLVAYIVFGTIEKNAVSFGIAEQIKELSRLVRHKLPGYMVPDRFVVLEDLPRKPDGRVDYTLLPVPGENDYGSDDYVAPRDKVEERVAEIWQDLLKIEKAGVKDSFFDLGGQSLLAVRMFTRIENEFGRKYPISMLFRAPTIEQLARKLTSDDDTESAWPSLVPVQPQGDKPPLFLVHGAGGNILLYRALAQYLTPEYPLYGLQSQGLDGQSKPLETIEEMADLYLNEIQAIQPKGPYLLGGYCLGGTIAYEMAQRLTARGKRVDLVALFDTYNFIRALKVGFFVFLLQKLRFHMANISQLGPGTLIKYLREKKRVANDGGWAHLRTERPGSTLQDGVVRAESGIEATVQELNDHAADIYDPKPYSGVLTLFKPQINYKFYPDPKMGWGDMAQGGLDIVEMPINPHAMLLEPYVKTLAQEVKMRIDRVA